MASVGERVIYITQPHCIRYYVCEDDPDILRRFLEQSGRQQVYQQVSFIIQKANAKIVTEVSDTIVRSSLTGHRRAEDARPWLSSSSFFNPRIQSFSRPGH